MPGSLAHSPADVVRRLLIALSHGADPAPTGTQTWPVYAASEPGVPDNCITVFDTEGVQHGRTAPDGERQEHHGVQIRIRATTHAVGYAKARAIAVSLDVDVERESITISGSTYCVHTVIRTSDVIPLGTETPASKRHLFTINALAWLRQSS